MKNLLIFVWIINPVFAQSNSYHLNTTIVIDNQIIMGESISEGTFVFGSKKMDFEYITGEIVLSEKDFEKLNSVDQNLDLIIEFKYRRINDGFFERDYQIRTKISWINKSFAILKIYNFDNKKNWKAFLEREGYGFEIFQPSQSKILPRRKRFNQDEFLKVDE